MDESKNWSQRKAAPVSASRTHSDSPASDVSSRETSAEPTFDHQIILSRSAVLSQAIGAFYDAYLPSVSGIATGFSQEDASTRWLRTAINEAHRNRGINDALMALAMSRASRITQNKNARRDALTFYGSCVSNVRRAVASGERIYDDSLLATVMLLAMFEVHEGTRKRDSAWTAHVNGASRLIDARGASSFNTTFGKTLYLAHLRDELVCGIGSRGRSRRGIDQSSHMPSEEDTIDDLNIRLVSILNTLPAIVEAADNIRLLKDINHVRSATISLYERCHEVMDALEAFDESLQWSREDILYWDEPSALYAALPDDSNERVMPQCFNFCDFVTACLQLTTWTSLLLMHSTLWLTYMWLRINRAESAIDMYIPDAVPPEQVTNCDIIAINIVKSMEYFVRPEAGLLGAQQLIYPMSIVLGYLSFWDRPEKQWFPVILRRLHELNVGIEGFVADSFRGSDLQMILPLAQDRLMKKQKLSVFDQVSREYESQEA